MEYLAYGAYGLAGAGALAVYAAMPRGGRPARRGLVWLLLGFAIGVFVLLMGRLEDARSGEAVFVVLSLLAVGGAVRVITHPRPVYSALYFVMVVISTAALAVLVGAEFLAAALVIVYAGAILVTYVFVIMMAQQHRSNEVGRLAAALDYDQSAREPGAAVLAGFVLVALVAHVIVTREWPASASAAATATAGGEGNTLALGRVLMTDFSVSLELAGVLLMVAMIGAIALARKRLPRADGGSTGLAPGEIGKHVAPF